MKRFLTILFAILMTVVAMAQDAGIVLSYNKGKELKFFKNNQITDAINDAQVNDTLYFGPGTYYLDYFPKIGYSELPRITKPLTFIGVGAHSGGTVFSGMNQDLYIDIDTSFEVSERKVCFEGIAFDLGEYSTDYYGGRAPYKIKSRSDLNELKFINVSGFFENEGVNDWDLGDSKYFKSIDNLIVDRCNLGSISMQGYRNKHMTITNTKSDFIEGRCEGSNGVAVIDHCSISKIDFSFEGLVKHSIIKTNNSKDATLEDCCYESSSDGSAILESTRLSISNLEQLDNDPSSLGKSKDGTPYGTSGGNTPYTEYSQYPSPDTSIDSATNKPKSYVEYDALNKKLTITIKRIGE